MRHLLLLTALACLSCASTNGPTTRPSSWSQQATDDPYNYNPKWEKQDISGGGIGEFDKKAFRKDLDNVLNP